MNDAHVEIIREAIATALTADSQGPRYFQRPAGSYIPWLRELGDGEGEAAAKMLLGMAADGIFEEVTSSVQMSGVSFGLCRYFRAPITGGAIGKMAVVRVDELTDDELASVREGRGHHGNRELVSSSHVPLRDTDELTIVIGNVDNAHLPIMPGKVTMYTWHPGPPASAGMAGNVPVKLT